MSRRKRSHRPTSSVSATAPRTDPLAPTGPIGSGDLVRVVAGVSNPDQPDESLAGWTGVVCEVDSGTSPPLYRVEWSATTLARITPVQRDRCARAGLELSDMWLEGASLELNPDCTEYRIRRIIGLPGSAALPPATREMLLFYRDHLKGINAFPAVALLGESGEPIVIHSVEVLGEPPSLCGISLDPAGTEIRLVPLTLLDWAENDPNAQPFRDYVRWMGEPAGFGSIAPLVRLALVVLQGGAVTGALLNSLPAAPLGALIGGGLLGVVGACLLATPRVMGPAASFKLLLIRLLLGTLLGSLVGCVLGTLAAGFVGTIPGAILGTVLGFLPRPRWLEPWMIVWVGLLLGGLICAVGQDAAGAILGLGAGLVAGVVVFGLALLGLVLGVRELLGERPHPEAGRSPE